MTASPHLSLEILLILQIMRYTETKTSTCISEVYGDIIDLDKLCSQLNNNIALLMFLKCDLPAIFPWGTDISEDIV